MDGGIPNDLFETIKVINGRIQLADLHFERLFKGLEQLKFSLPSELKQEKLEHEILKSCREKNCDDAAKVRLSVAKDEADKINYKIECRELDRHILYEQNLKIDFYQDERKDNDIFSHLKSKYFTCYPKAAKYAKQNALDDCILLNYYQNVTDSSISNVFIIRGKKIYTPPLHDGCVDGVMRKHLLKKLTEWNFEWEEASLEVINVINADELFLTNAIRGIRSVKYFREKVYDNTVTEQLKQHMFREGL